MGRGMPGRWASPPSVDSTPKRGGPPAPVTEIFFSENAPRIRKDFSKVPPILEIPNLIEIQKQSFERFLQTHVELEKRENIGLQAVSTPSSRSRTSTTPPLLSSWATCSRSRSTTCRNACSAE